MVGSGAHARAPASGRPSPLIENSPRDLACPSRIEFTPREFGAADEQVSTGRGCPRSCRPLSEPDGTRRAPIARKTDSVQFRIASPGDENAVAHVHVAAWQVAYRGMIPGEYLDGLSVSNRSDSWRQIIAETDLPSTGAFVAADGPQVLGFAHFCPSRDRTASSLVGEVTAIYVHPDRWGEGIGSRLMQLALESLEQAGFRSATLWVLDVNADARTFYEASGWAVDGATKDEQRSNFVLHEVRYAIDLPVA